MTWGTPSGTLQEQRKHRRLQRQSLHRPAQLSGRLTPRKHRNAGRILIPAHQPAPARVQREVPRPLAPTRDPLHQLQATRSAGRSQTPPASFPRGCSHTGRSRSAKLRSPPPVSSPLNPGSSVLTVLPVSVNRASGPSDSALGLIPKVAVDPVRQLIDPIRPAPVRVKGKVPRTRARDPASRQRRQSPAGPSPDPWENDAIVSRPGRSRSRSGYPARSSPSADAARLAGLRRPVRAKRLASKVHNLHRLRQSAIRLNTEHATEPPL